MATKQKIDYEALMNLNTSLYSQMDNIIRILKDIQTAFGNITESEFWEGNNADAFVESINKIFGTSKVIEKTTEEQQSLANFLLGVISTNKNIDEVVSSDLGAMEV